MAKKKTNPYRLDRNITPVVYDITLHPDIQNFVFTGHESITFTAKKPFSKITLHAAELKVKKAWLCGGKLKDKITAKKISYNEKFETVTLDFGRVFKANEAGCVCIEFDGIHNDKMHGFYRTAYTVKGEKRWGVATQFEATDARRAFPCWDEPDFKAKFKISLVVPQELTALSNMPVQSQSKVGNGLKQVHYQLTPIMSTYLVAMVVADLEYVEGKDKNGTLIRVYTVPGKKEQGRFGLEVALHCMPYFGEWFGIPYALPKCDMVSLPDFASGAMENWGLVTYRETALLVDPVNSSAAAKQRVAEVIDHELAHQWFGNLVTMEWWTDLWLNEGFASYMGPKAVHDQFPEWKIWDQFVVADYLRALGSDALRNTHPIEIPVQDPAEIREIFDAITYSKGSSVNRMLEHYLGEEVFRKGLRVYMKKFAYKNAATKDLWKALEQVSGKPVQKIMANFTRQPGFPVVKVERNKSNPSTLKLSQERFLFDGGKDTKKTIWQVPLVIRREKEKKPVIGLLKSASAVIDTGAKEGEWIKVNAGQSGFFRTAYSAELLTGLVEAMKTGDLPDPVIDTLGILSDAHALARAGYMKASCLLQFLEAVKDAREYNIWSLVSGSLNTVDNLLEKEEDHERLAEFARSLLVPCLNALGWEKKESDSHSDLLLRSMLISQAGHFGEKEVIDEAKKLFDYHIETGSLEPNLRGPVFALVAENGGARELEQLLNIYKTTTLQEEKVRIMRSLTRFKEKEQIAEVLTFALSKDVRSQDTYAILGGFGSNRHGRHQAWAYNKKNVKELRRRYEGGSVASMLGHIFEGSSTGFNKPAELKDVETFFKQNKIAGIERTMKQAVEIIRSNIRWTARDSKLTADWLAEKF